MQESNALAEPLVQEDVDIEEQVKEKPVPPSTILLIIFAIGMTLVGGSAMALPRLIKGSQKGLHWYQQQMIHMLILHMCSIIGTTLCGFFLYPQVRKNLDGLWHKKKGYEARYDTVKWTLTQVVAFSHIGLVFFEKQWFAVYNTHKEAWLMQTYFWISGYLSIPEPTRPRLQALWRSLVGAYVVNQSALFLLQKLLFSTCYQSTQLHKSIIGFLGKDEYTKSNFFIEFWIPIGALWYLPNLISSRLVAPFWMELRYPFLAAVALSTFILCLNSSDFSTKLSWLDMNSWLTMFPFYILGIKSRRLSAAIDAAFDWPGTRLAAIASLLTFLIFCYLNQANSRSDHYFGIGANIYTGDTATYMGDGWKNHKEHSWFNANTTRLTLSFQDILYSKGSQFLMYAWYLAVGGHAARITLIASVLSVFSRRDPIKYITDMGRRSISNYLMHWYLFLFLNLTWIGVPESRYGIGKIFLVLLIVVVQSNFWMWKPVYDIIRPIFLAPNLDWLLLERPSSRV